MHCRHAYVGSRPRTGLRGAERRYTTRKFGGCCASKRDHEDALGIYVAVQKMRYPPLNRRTFPGTWSRDEPDLMSAILGSPPLSRFRPCFLKVCDTQVPRSSDCEDGQAWPRPSIVR